MPLTLLLYQEIKGDDFMEMEMYFISYKNLYEIYHPL